MISENDLLTLNSEGELTFTNVNYPLRRRFAIEIGDVLAPARREVVIEGEDVQLEAVGPWAEAAAAYLAN